VSLRQEDDRLRVALLVYRHGVADQRPRRRPPAVRLTTGDRLRWQINYRFIRATYGGEWIYQLDTLNLACGQVDAEVFLRPPTHHIDERVSLW
jgi:hypothetical protein